jgi:hypothetical protein
MHVREHHAPVAHLLLVSGLIALAFLACEGLHLLDHGATAAGDRPAVHGVFVPHGMFVLLAWVYGWFMVPLVLPDDHPSQRRHGPADAAPHRPETPRRSTR